jgi:hypothetical protein
MLGLHRWHRHTPAVITADPELTRRVAREFREMPGLCLTLAQAMRLFSADARSCARVLDALVRTGVLCADGDVYRAAGRERRCA